MGIAGIILQGREGTARQLTVFNGVLTRLRALESSAVDAMLCCASMAALGSSLYCRCSNDQQAYAFRDDRMRACWSISWMIQAWPPGSEALTTCDNLHAACMDSSYCSQKHLMAVL